jgi:hypothetical protein
MATRKKKELDIEIPSTAKVMPTVDKSVLNEDSSIDVLRSQLVELNKNIKDLNETLNSNLDKIHTLAYSSDWKLWKIMNMIELIAKESGYVFSTDNSQEKENVK